MHARRLASRGPPATARPGCAGRRRSPRSSADGRGSRSARCAGRAGRRAGRTGSCGTAASPITGNAAASARVYGCAASANTLSFGPSSTIRPAYITAIRRQMFASVERSCVMKMIARPRSRWRSASRRSTCAWTITSSAVVGSSAISIRGSHAIASAIRTRWRWPPDSWCGYARRAPRRQAHQLEQLRPPASRGSPRSRECSRIASAIWSPTRCTGLSVWSAPWKTIASSVQRTARSRPGFMSNTSSPSSSTSPVTSCPAAAGAAAPTPSWTCHSPTRRRCQASRPRPARGPRRARPGWAPGTTPA